MPTPTQVEVVAHKNAVSGYGGLDTTGNSPQSILNNAFIPGSAVLRPYLHKALGNVLAGIKDAKICMGPGESTTYGYHDLDGIGPAAAMVKLFRGAGYPAATGLVIPNNPNSAFLGTDSRFAVGSGWALDTGLAWSFGGLGTVYAGTSGGAGTLAYTPVADGNGQTYDSCDVYYIQDTGFGTFKVNQGGGADTTQATAGTASIRKVSFTFTATATPVINFHGVTVAAVAIVGLELFSSTQVRVRVGNCGVSSSTTTEWVTTANPGIGPLDAIKAYAADYWHISTGVNDMVQGINQATTFANIVTIVAACKTTAADVGFSSPVPSSSIPYGVTIPQQEAAYTTALQIWCQANSYNFVDIFNRWGGLNGYTSLNPTGYYYDTLHPSTAGYTDIGLAQYQGIMSA